MPLTKRSVSPVEVSTNRIPLAVRSGELEWVSNGTLANLIRQLSSLSRHAEDLIGELHHEALKVQHKTSTLTARVERLQIKVTQLDSNVEEVSLKDLHLRKAFKSSALIDQHSLSRQTLPTAMGEAYLRCDAPPDLNKLNPFRDHGTEPGLKLYTDPDYFFRLWREEMLKDGDAAKKARSAGTSQSAAQPKLKRPKHKAQAQHQPHLHAQLQHNRGEDFVREMGQYQAPGSLGLHDGAYPRQPPPGMVQPHYPNGGAHVNLQQPHTLNYQRQPQDFHQLRGPAPVTSQYMAPHPGMLRRDETPTPTQPSHFPDPVHASSPAGSDSSRSLRPSQPPPAPPPPPQGSAYGHSNGQLSARLAHVDLDDSRAVSPDLPPPPPPITLDSLPPATSQPVPLAPAPPVKAGAQAKGGAPPPPPPPPPPPGLLNGAGGSSLKDQIAARAAERAANGTSFAGGAGGAGVNGAKAGPSTAKAPASNGGGGGNSELLRAIREGITLKKVERQEEKAKEKEALAKGDDVAAILRKRMEDVMGTSDSEDDPDFNDDDEWDE